MPSVKLMASLFYSKRFDDLFLRFKFHFLRFAVFDFRSMVFGCNFESSNKTTTQNKTEQQSFTTQNAVTP